MNDDFRDMMPTSQEFYADAKAEFGEVVEPDQPTAEVLRESEELDRQLENAYKCDDDDNDGYGTWGDDAWHAASHLGAGGVGRRGGCGAELSLLPGAGGAHGVDGSARAANLPSSPPLSSPAGGRYIMCRRRAPS